jgi:GNAT superfamily N-acetyltransferase
VIAAPERGELEAFRDLYAAAPPEVGARAAELGGALCISVAALPEAVEFNRALGLGLAQPATEAALEELASFFGGQPPCVAVAPHARPAQLASWVERRGLVPGYGWTKFSRPTAEPPRARTELRVERVRDGEPFAAAVVRGYGLPAVFGPWLHALAGRAGWHCFVAFDGETPAGAGALYVTGDVGWLGIGATAPELRGKGAQSAILAARIEAAASVGCTQVVTETGEPRGRPGPSYRNIVRAGFKPRYVRANYVPATAS